MCNAETLRALDALEGCDYQSACSRLLDLNYEKIGEGTDESTVFCLSGAAEIIRLFQHDSIPLAMHKLCGDLPDNPFLPKIYACRRISDHHDWSSPHALVMERLIHPDTLMPPDGNKTSIPTQVGMADAFRSLLLGDQPGAAKDHTSVYQAFGRSSRCNALNQLMWSIAYTIDNSCGAGSGNCLELNNRSMSRILLRLNSLQPVFADPLTIGHDRATAEAEMWTIANRCEQYFKPAKRGLTPAGALPA